MHYHPSVCARGVICTFSSSGVCASESIGELLDVDGQSPQPRFDIVRGAWESQEIKRTFAAVSSFVTGFWREAVQVLHECDGLERGLSSVVVAQVRLVTDDIQPILGSECDCAVTTGSYRLLPGSPCVGDELQVSDATTPVMGDAQNECMQRERPLRAEDLPIVCDVVAFGASFLGIQIECNELVVSGKSSLDRPDGSDVTYTAWLDPRQV